MPKGPWKMRSIAASQRLFPRSSGEWTREQQLSLCLFLSGVLSVYAQFKTSTDLQHCRVCPCALLSARGDEL